MGERRLLVAFFVCAFGAIALAQGASAAPEPCSVDLTVEDEVVDVTISSTQPGTASTTGTVTASLPPVPERAVISITGVVDTGWPISISPSSIQLSGGMSKNSTIYITIVVPPGVHVGSGLATLTARMVAGGIQCTPSTANAPTVVVRPYVEDVTVTTANSLIQVPPGGTRSVTVNFGSKSNADVSATIVYEAAGGVFADGPVQLSAPWRQNGTANGSVTIRVSAGQADLGIHNVTLTFTATAGEPSSASGHLALQVEVRNPDTLPGPGLAEALLAVAAVACARASRKDGGRAR